MLVVVCGLPGVGKTTVARMVADRLGVEPLRTDVVRRELFPDPSYTDEERLAVYETLFDRARARLDRGTDVVLDGTFADAAPRERTRELAATAGTERRIVRVTCEEPVVRERIAGRTGDESDADFEVYRFFESTFDEAGPSAEDTEIDDETEAEIEET